MDPVLWTKAILILIGIAISFYYGWIMGNTYMMVIYSLLISQTGINIMHDGVHGAYAKNSLINTLAALTFNVMAGCNFVTYRRAHAFGHHAYTNHLEYDTGITSAFPVLRLHPKLPITWYHGLQHLYAFFIYLTSLLLFMLGDYSDLFTLYNYPKRECGPSPKQWTITIVGKLIFCSWFFSHFYFFPFQKALLDCVVFTVLAGFFGLIFFTVNHWTEKAIHFTNEELLSKTNDWAVLQILTSCNFSIHSPFWTHLSGALNLQIEHHLFPAIAHTRLYRISPIVRDTCRQFGIDYDAQCYPNFWIAFAGNLSFLKGLGMGTFKSKLIKFHLKKN